MRNSGNPYYLVKNSWGEEWPLNRIVFSSTPWIGVQYIYLPADASGPFESYDYGKESYFIYQSGNADSFNKGYYENGTVVVYTATPVPFNGNGVPPFEKVAI